MTERSAEPRTEAGRDFAAPLAWHQPGCTYRKRHAPCDCGLVVRIVKVEAEAAALPNAAPPDEGHCAGCNGHDL